MLMVDKTSASGDKLRNEPVVFIIGSGEMPVQCANLLLNAGFNIAGIHSPDTPLQAWADGQEFTTFFTDFSRFRSAVETMPYDFLFSVVNFRILPSSLVESPRVLAINYHDAPLPRYAGSHATAWALHNREPNHGVTWHVISEKVDAGDILKQITFPLSGKETLEQLNQRCYLSAMRAFRALLPELKAQTFTRTPQDLAQRTFYARSSYPPAADSGGESTGTS